MALLYLRATLKSGDWEAFILGNFQGGYRLAGVSAAEPVVALEAA